MDLDSLLVINDFYIKALTAAYHEKELVLWNIISRIKGFYFKQRHVKYNITLISSHL